ncbi:FAD-dependent monooxygenase [Spongiactinospora sp. 9N601]|uniref:FAD-dependent monooxygenase n=1 Tax=Spongiactinospora sp. 9N601 TaxID=3375149 RepID=UPI0037879F87
MSTQDTADIVIAGAGIGGLSAALALHAHGIRALLLEAVDDIRPLGVGINIQPAAIAELTALGLGDALAETGIPTREHLYLDNHGTTLWAEPRGIAAGHSSPQYSLHRGELQVMLLNAVRERLGDDAVRTGVQVCGFEETGGGVRVHAHSRSTGAAAFQGAALIGADGARSAVLAQLHPGAGKISPGGVRMWRGVTEMDEFLDGRTMILVNDRKTTRIIAYPMSARHFRRGKALVNWVCIVSMRTDADDVQSRAGSVEEVLPYYANWDLGWLDITDLLSRSERILTYPMVDRDPLPVWGRGRVTLLGDAAHLMYPIGANGGSQAILDATTLATELAAGGDIPAALQRYEAVRRPATTAIVLANRNMDGAERAVAQGDRGDQGSALAEITSSYRAVVEQRRPAN